MATDKRISELTDVSPLTGAEVVEGLQGGVNKKMTTQQIADLGSTVTPSLTEVLTSGNSASGLVITNVGTPVSSGDATNKSYVDSLVPGTLPNLGDVLAEGNDAGGVTITNLPAPSASADAATKDYVDSVSSGSFHLADFTTITQASPTQVDCNSLKEPKFYLEVSSDTTLNITELRSDDTLSAYTTIYFRIRKKVAGDVVITLDSDYNNFDLASDATITAITLSGADEKIFWLTGIAYGLASSCDIAWNLVSTASGGGGGAVDSVNGQTGTVVLTATNIGNTATGNLVATNVQSSLAELDGDITAHASSSTAHAAASITYSAGGTVSATNVQSAIAEVAAEKLPLAGGTMTGDIAMGGAQKLTGLAAGTAAGHSVRYEQIIGVDDLNIPAGSWTPRVTNGPAPGWYESTTSLINIITLDFNQTTQQYATFHLKFPRRYSLTSFTFRIEWFSSASSGSVVWSIATVGLSDGDALSTAYGTAVQVTDAVGSANSFRNTAESSAVTIGNSPSSLDGIFIQLSRVTGDASDDMAADARLIGVSVHLTATAAIDA